MKTILLLGGFGFIGTNILKYIDAHLRDKYTVIVLDRFAKHLHDIQFECVQRVYAGDFSDTSLMEDIFANEHVDLVLHGISSTVPATSKSASYDIESNLLPTISLLDIMVRNKVFDIVFLSSGGAIYGECPHGCSHKESDDVFPKSSYGVVKLSIEKYLFQYKVYGIRPLILRLSNPYGPYHYSDKQGIVNVALKAAQSGAEFNVWGDGTASKDYIYVDDVCIALFNLLEQKIYSKVLNIASGEVLSVNEILYSIKKHYPLFKWNYLPVNMVDVSNSSLDTSRLNAQLNIKFTIIDEYLQSLFH